MTSDGERTASSKASWWKQPSSWLSIAAVLISATTFFFVYANPGTLKLYLPDEIGVGFSETGRFRLLVPLTVTNTGAPRLSRHVTSIRAKLRTLPPRKPASDINVSWAYEYKFISYDEYHKSHQDDQSKLTDYVQYVNRAFPFFIAGHSSVTRIYAFDQKQEPFPGLNSSALELTVYVHTDRGNYTRTAQYTFTDQIRRDVYNWAQKKK